MIDFQCETTLSVAEFQQVLVDSTLGERRPVEDPDRLAAMIAHANLIVTAREHDDGRLVGVARSVTDFSFCCYLSDLAVAVSHQHRGIGRRLVDLTQKELHPDALLILLSAPAAVDYYPKIGFALHPAAFTRRSS